MTKIKTLREDVFRKIAAGEVVERPLSVVKELVENAIDAGADDIKIELREGGKQLIKVSDNGSGFAPDDIETAFKNHSTSKLDELADFDHLTTLGFRGEALPSILEVSRIHLETSDNDDGVGISCHFEDGRLHERKTVACKRGSSISVRDLFYNFPVRSKFLKTERTELNQIISFLEPLTLVHFAVSFELIHNGRCVFVYKKAETLTERIYQVFGKDFLETLQPLSFSMEGYRLEGYISRLNTGLTVKTHQYYFVNGRSIREKTMMASFNANFQRYLEKHRFPVGILLFTIPPHEVDVNIHPMKLEIKFVNSTKIFRFIKYALDSAFGLSLPEEAPIGFDNRPRADGAFSEQEGLSEPDSALTGVPRVPGGASVYNRPNAYDRHNYRYNRESHAQWRPAELPEDQPRPDNVSPRQNPANSFSQERLFSGNFFSEDEFILIGQYQNSYIIIERKGELIIVDQHNAQERHYFDKLKREYQEHKIPAISPLFPMIVDLTPSGQSRLDPDRLQMLENLGFRLEPLSGNSYDIKSFPQVLTEKSVQDALMELIHLEGDPTALEDSALAQIACKSSVKVNTRLYPEEMNEIVRNLYKSSNPYFCPHKRPIIIEFPLEQIEKMLKRR